MQHQLALLTVEGLESPTLVHDGHTGISSHTDGTQRAIMLRKTEAMLTKWSSCLSEVLPFNSSHPLSAFPPCSDVGEVPHNSSPAAMHA